MGLHTGEPAVGPERYVGLGVHRAARLMAAGHGGQILLSAATRELIEDDLPPDATLRDLGEQRLRDLERPERVSQLVVEGLPADFPPLRTVDEPTPFAGRENELALAARAAITRQSLRRRSLLAAALAGVVAAAIAIPVFALGQGDSGGGGVAGPAGNSLVAIDPDSGKVTTRIPLGTAPARIALGRDAVWVGSADDQTVLRVDPRTKRVVKTIGLGFSPVDVAVGSDGVWVAGGVDDSIVRIDPRSNVVAQTIEFERKGFWVGNASAVAAGAGGLWVLNEDRLSRIDERTREVDASVRDVFGSALAVGEGAAWVTARGSLSSGIPGSLSRIDLETRSVGEALPLTGGPSGLATGAGAIWVAASSSDTLWRVDPVTRTAQRTISVGGEPTAVAVGKGSVWVANSADGTVSRVDPKTNAVATITVGGSPQGVAVGENGVWVAVARREPLRQVASGRSVVRFSAEEDFDSVDPALAYSTQSSQVEYATCAKLMNFPDRPAPEGSRIRPEVATALPTVSRDGKTFTFTIRDGFRFSPPSAEPVTALTFKYSIERTLNPRMPSYAFPFVSDIVGAKAYHEGNAQHISGVVARGRRLTIRLTHASVDLPVRLTLPFFCAVPTSLPINPRGATSVPSAGPYYVASYTPKRRLVLRRNPNYAGSRPHRVAEIVYTLGVPRNRILRQVERGAGDYAVVEISQTADARLAQRFGPDSPAAKAGKQRYFVHPTLAVSFFALNTARPLFRDVELRRAVNYAVDRSALAGLSGIFSGDPTDQYLAPGLPGFTNADIYPLKPDLVKARRLARGKGATAVLYTVAIPGALAQAQILQANLRAIGIDLVIKQFPFEELNARAGRRGEPFDIVFGGWFPDYPDPANVLNTLFDGSSIRAEGNPDFSYFDDPRYNARLQAAARLSGPRRYAEYGRLDISLARDAAPMVALYTLTQHDFFSARIGCQVYNPIYGIDIAALCLRR